MKDTLKVKHNIDVKVIGLRDPTFLYFCHEILVEVIRGSRILLGHIENGGMARSMVISCEITITIPGIVRHQTSIVWL